MSIMIHIYYTGKNGAARLFADEMMESGIVEKIRAESGNMRYDYFFPADDPETVLLIDEWEDQAALDVHHTLPLMGQIMILREKYDLHMRVERYIPDKAGMPSVDETFIRK
ncbi:MAG: putative quinol monooxygenase [Eubacteriales bacterium]|nr:putative quinol monooxygenase [Eubacteriales bacterium]